MLSFFFEVLAKQFIEALHAFHTMVFVFHVSHRCFKVLFGVNVRVLTVEIFTARQRVDMVIAVTETVVLAVISLAALIAFQRYEGTRKFAAATMKGAPRRRATIASGKARVIAAIAAVIFAIVLVAPVATLILVSFAREGSWTTQTLPAEYTFANYQRIFSDPFAAEVFVNSLSMSAVAAVAALLWSFCVVTLLVKQQRGGPTLLGKSGRRLLSLLILIPWALPGTVVAVSVAEAYGQRGSLLGSFVLVGTFWILPVVYFLRFMPLVVRALQASMEQVDPALGEAARSLGARAWQRFARVTLPLVWPGAMTGNV